MGPRFRRTCETIAIYRLLVPLPVSVDWPSGRQTFSAEQNGLHSGELLISGPGRHLSRRCEFRDADHVRHNLANGFKVQVPSLEYSFFERLVREGRAEVICAPCEPLYWLNYSVVRDLPVLDAYYTYKPGLTNTSGTMEWAAREAAHNGKSP